MSNICHRLTLGPTKIPLALARLMIRVVSCRQVLMIFYKNLAEKCSSFEIMIIENKSIIGRRRYRMNAIIERIAAICKYS